jgi:antitoxin CptB
VRVSDTTERARLRWRCRRGTRELDVVLARYCDARMPEAGAGERAALSRLLELPDPLLYELLILGRAAPRDLEDVVEHVRAHAARAGA